MKNFNHKYDSRIKMKHIGNLPPEKNLRISHHADYFIIRRVTYSGHLSLAWKCPIIFVLYVDLNYDINWFSLLKYIIPFYVEFYTSIKNNTVYKINYQGSNYVTYGTVYYKAWDKIINKRCKNVSRLKKLTYLPSRRCFSSSACYMFRPFIFGVKRS